MSSILVVDDEPAIVETVAELLSWEGHSVLTANDGEHALERLRDGTPIEVVILDFMMPVKDGIQTLREIRADAELARLKVILTTAAPTSIPKDALGAYDALLVKPFSVDELKDAIARVLK